jgi:hypothetical protein
MSDESQQEVVLADTTAASDQEATVAPETEVVTPEAVTPKSYTQEEFDALAAKQRAIYEKNLAKEQRKWERDQAARATEAQARKAPVDIPPIEQFASPDEYAEVLAERKAEELLARREQARQHSETLEAYHDREEEARTKYDDFEQVVYNSKLPITDAMAQTIQASEVGPDMAYYLGSNPKEAERISRLTPLAQAKELGKIEAKLADNPPVKKTSSAPAPIAPVTARSSGSSVVDTTDPRSIKNMSTSEWIEAERQRQIKKWEAQRNR